MEKIKQKYKEVLIELQRRFYDVGTPYYHNKEDYKFGYEQAHIKYEQLKKYEDE